MSETRPLQRKLTTILAADAANFSGRMAADEAGTIQALRASRQVFETGIAARGGRIANTAGDGLIADFPSVVEAVAAAVTIQQRLRAEPEGLPFRIGIHLGDVIVEGSDLLGDGVNLAARLQELAPEGGILVSRQVVDQAQGRLSAEFRPMGPATPKHMPNEIALYGVIADGVQAPGALDDVATKTGKAVEQADASVDYRKFRNRMAVPIGTLAAIDLTNGPGPSWFLILPMAIMVGMVLKRWRQSRAI